MSLSGRQNLAHIGCRAAIDLADAELVAHGIDNHEHDVADTIDRLSQELQVGHKAKHLVITAHAGAVDEVDARDIGAGRDHPWQDGIARGSQASPPVYAK